LLCAAIVVVARLLVAGAQNDWDEELYWQVAQAWRVGGVPYADVFDHKAPFVYVLQLLYTGFSESYWLVRATATFVLAGSAACFAFAMWPGRRDLAGGFTFLILLTLSSFGCIGANTEFLYAPYILLTGAALLRGAIAPAALAAAVAVNIKYTVGLDIAGVVAFAVTTERLSLRRSAQFFVAFGVIATVIWLGLFGYFHARGVDLFEATVAVNFMHAGSERRFLFDALGSYAVTRFILVVVALTLCATLSGQRADRRLRLGLGAWAAASLLQATITGKTYFHYFTPIFIPFCVYLVAHWDDLKSRRYRVASTWVGAALALVLLAQGMLRHRDFAQTEAWLEREVCQTLEGQSVYIADEFLATYRICGIVPGKWMYPTFVFEPHFIRLAGSRGPRELESYDVVVILSENRFAEFARHVRNTRVVELSPPASGGP
jgi:hypothetical protein